MKQWLKTLEHELRVTLTKPGSQLTRGQRFIQLSIDLARHARRQLRENSASTMAAALTYRTIFGLVPMIVMALIVFRAFGGFADSKEGLTNLVYKYLNLEIETVSAVEELPPDSVVVPEDGTPEEPEPLDEAATRSWLGLQIDQVLGDEEAIAQAQAAEQERNNAAMRARIDELVGGIAEGATTISIGSIGVVGMLLLIWAAVGLIVTVEKTFNTIFKAPEGRPWHVRIPIYWAMITLGPVLIWGSFYISTQLVDAAQEMLPIVATLLGILNRFTALLVTWLLFVLLFKLMPNAQVAIRPAMAGAMVSALSWEILKMALRWYVETAVITPTQASLYGSLALIPVLLFWVYLSWMVVLAGLQVTHILQTLPAHRRGKFALEHTGKPAAATRDPWLVIPVMSAVAQAFDAGKTAGIDAIAEQIGAPIATVSQIIDELVDRGLLHRLPGDDGPGELTLAMPPGRIRIADLIATSPEHSNSLPGHELLMQLVAAQDKALADVTLETPTTSASQMKN
ncbi:MAG: YhjD/YihY/BrkB family envelope integrity protein [Planctomycetota bacterium]